MVAVKTRLPWALSAIPRTEEYNAVNQCFEYCGEGWKNGHGSITALRRFGNGYFRDGCNASNF